MFSVTYLGHQGWLIRGGDSRILVDPLLTDEYSPGFSAEIATTPRGCSSTSPRPAGFAPVAAAQPLERYALGLECWAADLWRVLVGRQLPQRLLGHLRTWSFSPAPLSPLFAVWGFFDALHRPAAAAAFYGALTGRLRAQPPVVPAGRHARRIRRGRRSRQIASG